MTVGARRTARAVMLDPDSRVLLFEFLLPAGFIADAPRHFWATPGGEIEPGEDVHDALRREVREETGIADFEVGPELWFGSNLLVVNGVPRATLERFFLVRTNVTTVASHSWTEVEKKVMLSHRWWRVGDLASTAIPVFPPHFANLVTAYLADGSAGPREIPL